MQKTSISWTDYTSNPIISTESPCDGPIPPLTELEVHMNGLDRLHEAWNQADGDARRAFWIGVLEAQGIRGEQEITMVSQVNSRDGSPAVLLKWGEQTAVLSSATAKRHGFSILETALGAEADAFIFQWLQHKVGVRPEEAAQVLMDFRHWRETQEQAQAREGSA